MSYYLFFLGYFKKPIISMNYSYYIFNYNFCQYLRLNFLAYINHGNFFFSIVGVGVGGTGEPLYLTIVLSTFGIPKASAGFSNVLQFQ